jgi:hypothetical protein
MSRNQDQPQKQVAPFTQFDYADVQFGAADTDQLVPHAFTRMDDPEQVGYVVVQADRACRVYHDTSVTRRAWGANFCILRCDTPDAAVRLLLTLPR